MDRKYKKKESIIKRELMDIIFNNLCSTYEFYKIIINDVELYRDYSKIDVYVSFLDLEKNDQQKYLNYLNKNSYEIKNKLIKQINLKKVPKLEFLFDSSHDNASRINDILNSLKSN